MRRLAPALLGILLLPTACVAAAPPPPTEPAPMENQMPEEPVAGSFDRNPPPAVPSVARGGKRYAQRLGSHDGATGQSGGLIDVIDEKTGAVEAVIKVYDNPRDPAVEGDAQDIFFQAMAFDASGRLIVTDEVGRRFAVDVATRVVMALP